MSKSYLKNIEITVEPASMRVASILIGENGQFISSLHLFDKYAELDALKVVLPYGETGTEEKLFAKDYHEYIQRSKQVKAFR